MSQLKLLTKPVFFMVEVSLKRTATSLSLRMMLMVSWLEEHLSRTLSSILSDHATTTDAEHIESDF